MNNTNSTCNALMGSVDVLTGQCNCRDRLWLVGVAPSGPSCEPTVASLFMVYLVVLFVYVLVCAVKLLRLLRVVDRHSGLSFVIWLTLTVAVGLLLASLLIISIAPSPNTFHYGFILTFLGIAFAFFSMLLYICWFVLYLSADKRGVRLFRIVHFTGAALYGAFALTVFFVQLPPGTADRRGILETTLMLVTMLFFVVVLGELGYVLYLFWRKFYQRKANRSSYFSRRFFFIWIFHLCLGAVGFVTFVLILVVLSENIAYINFLNNAGQAGLLLASEVVVLLYLGLLLCCSFSTMADVPVAAAAIDDLPVLFFPCGCWRFIPPDFDDSFDQEEPYEPLIDDDDDDDDDSLRSPSQLW